jgi:hypothetical protein
LSLKQKWEMKQVYDDVLRLRRDNSDTWFLVAGENSWTLPFLAQSKMDWKLTPQWGQISQVQQSLAESKDAFALVLDTQFPQNLRFQVVKSYPSANFILRIPAYSRRKPE